jgi:membrane protein DedA with SNARE-associated domain
MVETLLEFLKGHEYTMILVSVFLDVLGAPGTAIPLLLVGGSLAATGKMSLLSIIVYATLASAVGDALWYGLGRLRSRATMKLLSSMSGEGSRLQWCLRILTRHSVAFLVISKFVPGIATIAPPAAGLISMPVLKFLFFDTLGRMLWAGTVSSLGYFIGNPLP